MLSKVIKLKLTSEKNCFLSIPRSWRDEIQQKPWFYFEMINPNNSDKFCLEWSGNCVSDDFVELSATFAAKIGFLDNQTVLINVIDKEIEKANQIIIQPNSEFDWENFTLYSSEIESNFLNQARIVSPNMLLPIWPRPDICIYLKIHFIDQNQNLLRMENFTELIGVIEDSEIKRLQQKAIGTDYQIKSNEQSQQIRSIVEQSNQSALSSFFKFLPQLKMNNIGTSSNSLIKPSRTEFNESYILPTLAKSRSNTILNIIDANQISSVNLNKLNTVYVNASQLNTDHGNRSIGKLIRLLSPSELNARKELVSKKAHDKSKHNLDEENQYLETVVEIDFIDQCPSNSLIPCHSLTLQLDLYPFSKVILNSVDQPKSLNALNNQKVNDLTQQIANLDQTNQLTLINLPVVNSVSFAIYQTITNIDQISSSIASFLKEYCSEHNFIILNRSSLIKFSNYELTFQPEFSQNDCLMLTEQSVQSNLEIPILNQPKSRIKTSWNVDLPRTNLDQILKKSFVLKPMCVNEGQIFKFENYKSVFDQCTDMIDQCSSDKKSCVSNYNTLVRRKTVLIHGKKGCGKTTLVNDLVSECHSKEKQFSFVSLDCAKLKSKKIDLLKKSLFNSLNESIYAQPCVLVIENLHILLPSYSNIEQEHKLDLLYNEKVKLILIELVNYLNEASFVYGSKLFTIVTSRSDDLFENQNLELDMFDSILEIKAPSPECSLKLINHLIKSKLKDYRVNELKKNELEQLEMVLTTELTDCLPLDLNVIADQIIMHSFNRNLANSGQQINLKLDDFIEVFNSYVPFSLRSIKSVKSKNKFRNKKLDDLGGLKNVKERLKQIIHWPIKYPKLFANYPIEPQTCVLLYGMPGTGKTFIAQALANEFKINFISIKGPEILSKYIGASEKAIRELFEKAHLSKPCILFFDEFDSIVPPRQNNNTDVTDRIVNQILTQMDGIESLQEGIYILAATSRPDMIDPALLRPGRFDVCLECNLPTTEEREQILNLLSKQVNLDKEVDLIEIAHQTTNYTGSDLNTLIINATNQAINELIDLDEELNVQNHEEFERNLSDLKLNNSHLQKALQLTSPSFNALEIADYNRIFSKLKSEDSYEKQDLNIDAKSIFAS